MWKLKSIDIDGIASFHKAIYLFKNNVATLVYGENLDNESQLSNGSGKSSLSEAIAFCLLGSPLRQVKNEEIINNDMDSASVTLALENTSTGNTLLISRTVSRKGPQQVSLTFIDKDYNQYPVVKSSVDEYNKYILDMLGVTKDDIYGSFILCKSRYKDFLLSSDKEKKDIINRFSRANMVDQSIETLKSDKEKVNSDFRDKELEKSKIEGRIEALQQTMRDEAENFEKRKKDKEASIKQYNENIEKLEAKKKETQANIDSMKKEIDNITAIADELNDYESNNYNGSDFDGIKRFVSGLATFVDLSGYSDADLTSQISEYNQQIEKETSNLVDLSIRIEKEKVVSNALSEKLQIARSDRDKLNGEVRKYNEIRDKTINEENKRIKNIEEDRVKLTSEKAMIEAKLAKRITCPHCGQEFVLSDPSFSIALAKDRLESIDVLMESHEKTIQDSINTINKITSLKLEDRDRLEKADAIINDLEKKIKDNTETIYRLCFQKEKGDKMLSYLQESVDRCEEKRSSLIDDMMDCVFSSLDKRVKSINSDIQMNEKMIGNTDGMIESNREMIKSLENEEVVPYSDTIKQSIDKYESMLSDVKDQFNSLKGSIEDFEVQESNFNMFKTYLANSKIDALSHATNEFLEHIGSDLRVRFNGYTMLKSGKVRDKISVSVLRDGIDIGSFGKLSVGEMSRVQLAVILAMHNLVNLNADNDKGLDLLLIDEVLDGVDESGLDNIIKSINKIGVTSIIISHGKTAESYPYRLVVRKQNGVSAIYG